MRKIFGIIFFFFIAIQKIHIFFCIISGEKATKWETGENEVDGLTTNGVLIMHPKGQFCPPEGCSDPKPGIWREISVWGCVFGLQESRSALSKHDWLSNHRIDFALSFYRSKKILDQSKLFRTCPNYFSVYQFDMFKDDFSVLNFALVEQPLKDQVICFHRSKTACTIWCFWFTTVLFLTIFFPLLFQVKRPPNGRPVRMK